MAGGLLFWRDLCVTPRRRWRSHTFFIGLSPRLLVLYEARKIHRLTGIEFHAQSNLDTQRACGCGCDRGIRIL